MTKRKEQITIHGETFILENVPIKKDFYCYSFKRLDDCYERPSIHKQRIYDYWEDWFRSLGANMCECGIGGYNCMQFTYHGFFTYRGVKYYAYITKCYNRLFIVI